MNKYQTISQYGVYINRPPSTLYNPNDSNIDSGQNHLIYDDGSTKIPANQQYFSQLSSVFQPNRPDPGIILMQKYKGTLIAPNATNLRGRNVNPYQPRYYAFSEFRAYDYWNSAKVFVKNGQSLEGGRSTRNGEYLTGHPFVVYEDIFPCNKITIQVQDHISVPAEFSVQVLKETSPNVYEWKVIYGRSKSIENGFNNGKLNLYFDSETSSWVKVLPNTDIGRYLVDDISTLDDSDPTEFELIKGIRIVVHKMSVVNVGTPPRRHRAALELLEISPRLEVNLSNYTESFNFNTTLGDNSSFGLPVGSLVSSDGSISISNEDGVFLLSGKLSKLNMLSPDVKFMFYQIVNDGASDKAVPLKVMYSNEWNISQDYSVSVGLEDGFKFLRETSAPDLLLQSPQGQRLSVIVLFLLDNVGITDYVFEKTSNDADGQDIFIRSFFSKREQTVAEVLEELAVATQCSIYFDCLGKLKVMTKERLTSQVRRRESEVDSQGTDFWMILDEDYGDSENRPAEFNFINSYTANVSSYTETQLSPVTEGNIVYHVYGPRKQPRLDQITKKIRDDLLEGTVFPASLASFNIAYNTRTVWRAEDETENATLGAANLIEDLPEVRLKNIFNSTIVASNEDQAVRKMYSQGSSEQKKSMIIKLDKNEGLLIGPYQGTVLIGTEYIKYNGKLLRFSFGTSTEPSYVKILFSQEEVDQEIRNMKPGGSITFIGLVVDVKFRLRKQVDEGYEYRVIGDGRAKLGSSLQKHNAFTEDRTGLDESFKYGITLGGTNNKNHPVPRTSVKNNFLDRVKYRSAKRILAKKGLALDRDLTQSYLGFLKMEGRNNQKDRDLYNKLYKGELKPKEIKDLNTETDKKVPGKKFDDFVLFDGERSIYGQRIDVRFKPNIISTRVRLFSPRRKTKNEYLHAETVSSIAGIAFGVNQRGEGYYLEAEGISSGKGSIEKDSYRTNLRFYKVFLEKNSKGEFVYTPKLLLTAPVGAYVTENVDVQIIKGVDGNVDPFFDLSIVIEYPKEGEGVRYTIRYGDTRIGRFVESKKEAIDGNAVALFVRGDSQAIFEYVSAAQRPVKSGDIALFKGFNRIDDRIKSGIIPINEQFLYKTDNFKHYFNDFAKLVREVKDLDVRFEYPSYISRLIDVSEVSGDYMIKKYSATPFGAKIVVMNTSPGPIILTESSNTPLYVVAVALEELSTGTVTMDDFIDKVEEKRNVDILDREKNKLVFGSQSFTIDSQYMQSISQARRLMNWIVKNCSRPRIKMNLEIFANPLLELGDKVRIYDKSRGYNEDNPYFGNRTFVISAISYGVNESGPTMNVEILEVGEGQ
jgi:hypothetical protein